MKKYIFALLFAIGFSSLGYSQTARHGKREKAHKHIKPYHADAVHFEHPEKKDKLLAHNGTDFIFRGHKSSRVVKSNGYASNVYYREGKKWRRAKNNLFGTVQMKEL